MIGFKQYNITNSDKQYTPINSETCTCEWEQTYDMELHFFDLKSLIYRQLSQNLCWNEFSIES